MTVISNEIIKTLIDLVLAELEMGLKLENLLN